MIRRETPIILSPAYKIIGELPSRIVWAIVIFILVSSLVPLLPGNTPPLVLMLCVLAVCVAGVVTFRTASRALSVLEHAVGLVRSKIAVSRALALAERAKITTIEEVVSGGELAHQLLRKAYPLEMAKMAGLAVNHPVYFVIDERDPAPSLLVVATLKGFGLRIYTFSEDSIRKQALDIVLREISVITLENGFKVQLAKTIRVEAAIELNPDKPRLTAIEDWLKDPHQAYLALEKLFPNKEHAFETSFLGAVISIVTPFVPRRTGDSESLRKIAGRGSMFERLRENLQRD